MFCGFGFLSPLLSSCRLLYLVVVIVITVVCCAISFFFVCLMIEKNVLPCLAVFAYGNCLGSLAHTASLSFHYALCWVNNGRMVLAARFLVSSPFQTPTGLPPHPRLVRVLALFSFLSRGTGVGGHVLARRPAPSTRPNAPRSAAPRYDALETVHHIRHHRYRRPPSS